MQLNGSHAVLPSFAMVYLARLLLCSTFAFITTMSRSPDPFVDNSEPFALPDNSGINDQEDASSALVDRTLKRRLQSRVAQRSYRKY